MDNPERVYLGNFSMPKDLEVTIFEFCRALKRNGYNVGFLTSFNGEVDSVHLFKWLDGDETDDYLLEYGADGAWNRVEWERDGS